MEELSKKESLIQKDVPFILQNLTIFNWHTLLDYEEQCISLLEDLDLIPRRNDSPPTCPACFGPMSATAHKKYTLKWRWTCKKKKKKSMTERCSKSISPLQNTFFEKSKLPFRDTLALIFGFVMKLNAVQLHREMTNWRRIQLRKEKSINHNTVFEYYHRFKRIGMTIMKYSRDSEMKKETSNEKLLQAYYKRLDSLPFLGQRVFQFLLDIKPAFPGFGNVGLDQSFLHPISDEAFEKPKKIWSTPLTADSE